MATIKLWWVMWLAICVSAAAQSKPENGKGPDLSGSWPTTLTLRVLQDERLIDAAQVDTDATWSARLASEQVGKNLWNQVYLVRFKLRSGDTVQAIAVVNASPIADMQSGPVVYVVSKVLQPEGKPEPTKR